MGQRARGVQGRAGQGRAGQGTYSFALPDLAPGAIRELRDPDATGEDDDE